MDRIVIRVAIATAAGAAFACGEFKGGLFQVRPDCFIRNLATRASTESSAAHFCKAGHTDAEIRGRFKPMVLD